jgi:hypothetical protein
MLPREIRVLSVPPIPPTTRRPHTPQRVPSDGRERNKRAIITQKHVFAEQELQKNKSENLQTISNCTLTNCDLLLQPSFTHTHMWKLKYNMRMMHGGRFFSPMLGQKKPPKHPPQPTNRTQQNPANPRAQVGSQ